MYEYLAPGTVRRVWVADWGQGHEGAVLLVHTREDLNLEEGPPLYYVEFDHLKYDDVVHLKEGQRVARGEQIFNTQPLTISNVPGLATGTEQIMGTCTTCHDNFNVGNHSFPLPLDIGNARSLAYETDPNIIAGLKELNEPTLPVFQSTCTQGPLAGNIYYTSDPGKALITGQCSDIGRGKGLILRGLAARAPYFHNGSAGDLHQR